MGEEDGVSEVSHATWRNRFMLMFLLQVGGAVLTLFALLLWQTSYIVAGGSVLGFPLALVGLVISFFGPRLLARHWKSRDR